MQAIQTMGLVKQYKNLTSVDKLDLEIQQGELFSLLGVNGAGKTTRLQHYQGAGAGNANGNAPPPASAAAAAKPSAPRISRSPKFWHSLRSLLNNSYE